MSGDLSSMAAAESQQKAIDDPLADKVRIDWLLHVLRWEGTDGLIKRVSDDLWNNGRPINRAAIDAALGDPRAAVVRHPMHPPCDHRYEDGRSALADRNVVKVMEKLEQRAEAGLVKYGVTTERTDLSLLDWLNHLQDELMDACVYVERPKGDAK